MKKEQTKRKNKKEEKEMWGWVEAWGEKRKRKRRSGVRVWWGKNVRGKGKRKNNNLYIKSKV